MPPRVGSPAVVFMRIGDIPRIHGDVSSVVVSRVSAIGPSAINETSFDEPGLSHVDRARIETHRSAVRRIL